MDLAPRVRIEEKRLTFVIKSAHKTQCPKRSDWFGEVRCGSH